MAVLIAMALPHMMKRETTLNQQKGKTSAFA
jgi:hypothetical protein